MPYFRHSAVIDSSPRMHSMMNRARSSIGQTSLHGMATSPPCPVTHLPGLTCYLCARSEHRGPHSPLAPLGRALRARRISRHTPLLALLLPEEARLVRVHPCHVLAL